MQFLRKLALTLALLLYAPLLLILPTVISLNATLNKPTFIKEKVAEAKLYPALSTYILEQINKSTEASASPLIGQTASEVFTPTALQEVFEPVVDSIYTWLDNPQEKFDISINTKSLQDSFKAKLDQNLGTQLATLPPCSRSLQPTSTDPYQLNCIPAGVSIESIRTEAQAQINQNRDLAEQETISLTEDSTAAPAPEAPQSPDAAPVVSEQTKAPQLNVDQFKMLAKLYRITKASTPWIIGLLVITTAAILALSSSWIQGVKRTGIFLAVNGGLLLISSVGTSFLFRTLLPVPATDESIGAAGREIADLLTRHMLATTRNFAIAYLVIGIIAIISAIVLKKKSAPSKAEEAIPQEHTEDELGEKSSSSTVEANKKDTKPTS